MKEEALRHGWSDDMFCRREKGWRCGKVGGGGVRRIVVMEVGFGIHAGLGWFPG